MIKPWEETLKGWGRGVITSETGALRIEVDTDSLDDDEEAERFFAAAPDMARALRKASAMLAGASHGDGCPVMDDADEEDPPKQCVCLKACESEIRAALTKAGVPL